MRKIFVSLLAIMALLFTLVASPAAAAPPGGGGGGEEEEAGNNLSVPTIFVPDATGAPALRLPCGAAQEPGADGAEPSTEFPGYWLQKTAATWTADCATAAAASVIADWGDNLTSAPNLAAGKPIRVEVGLLDPAATGMTGYVVENLTPDLEDRLATYGTDGTAYVTGDAEAPYARVWDSGATLKIEQLSPVVRTIYDGPMSAEINSVGAVVFGYNWGVMGQGSFPTAGIYKLTFSTSAATTITGVADVENRIPDYNDHSTWLTVSLGGARPNLTVATAGTGTGTVAVSPDPAAIALGDVATLTALPGGGSIFTGWTVDGIPAGWPNPLTITMDRDHAVVATFAIPPSFSDVQPSDPEYHAIVALASRGIILGYGDGSFGIDDTALRAQMAALIVRAMGWSGEVAVNPFTDQGTLDPALWNAIGILASHDVALGYGDGTFGPNDLVTCAQTITFITRALVDQGYWTPQPGAVTPYTGVPAAHAADVATFYYYTAALGGLPQAPTTEAGWHSPATRGWFAMALWQALSSQFAFDQVP